MSLLGVWKAKGESRHIYVHRTDGHFAYARRCSANGMRVPGAREVRIRLTADREGVQRYERPDGVA